MSNPNVSLSDPGQMRANPFLTQPSQFMPIVVDAIQDELAFYSYDFSGKTTFLSKSAKFVLNHCPEQRLDRPFWDFLTDNSCNDPIRSWKASTDSSGVVGRVCEIFDSEGNRLKLKFWQVPIIHEGLTIGQSGIFRRLCEVNDSESLGEKEQAELMAKVGLLTEVELKVIDMVVDGRMNKEMAAILNVAIRTIESRRSRAMAKLKTKTISELVQAWVQVRRIRAASNRGLQPELPSSHSKTMNGGTLCGSC